MGLLDIDQVQADAILAMQLRTLTRMNRDKIVAEHEELQRKIADYIDILAKPERQRKIIGDELDEIVAKYGDDRRTKILPFSGEMNVEDLIAEENVVVTVTHSGFIKRTKADEYRSQHRGGKGIKGTKLREDDVVDHFFLTSTHNWLLFFTNKGRVYRIKPTSCPRARATPRASTWPTCCSSRLMSPSRPCCPSRTTRWPSIWCSPPVPARSRRPRWPSTIPRARAA